MANLFQSSFVPQQPLLKVESGQPRREAVNIPLVVSLVVFFVTLALTGGAYLYQQQLEKQVLEKLTQLELAEKLFDTNKISFYKNLQTTLASAKSLSDAHTIFSLIFDLIETKAANNIGLVSLSYNQDGNDAFLTLSGQAPSYEALYYQVQKWRESKPVVKSVDVSTVTLEETTGIVIFSVKIAIDPLTLGNARMLSASSASSIVPAQPTAQPVTATTTVSASTTSETETQ